MFAAVMRGAAPAQAYVRSVLYEPYFQNQPTPTVVFRAACLLVLALRLLRELQWAIVLSPLLLLGTCGVLSGVTSLLRSRSAKGLVSQACGCIRSSRAFSLCTSACTRLKVESRAGWKRTQPFLEAKCASVYKAFLRLSSHLLGSRSKSPNAHAAVAAALLVGLGTLGSALFWAVHRNAPASPSATHMTPLGGVASSVGGAPTLSRPFLYIHVPGSGGVSYRTALNSDVLRLNAMRFMPCYGGLKCAINTDQEFNRTFISEQQFAAQLTILQREMRCATVIAGHFKMSLLGVLASLDDVGYENACPSRQWPKATPGVTRRGAATASVMPGQWPGQGSMLGPNVVIMLRHPLQRIVAHYYRFGQTGPYKGRPFGSLSAMEVQVFLKQSGENLVLSYLTTAKVSDFASTSDAVANAMVSLRRCTVGIFEFWQESSLLIATAAPWLTPPLEDKQVRLHPGREQPAELEPVVQGVLINRLVAEMRLYEGALRRFKKQARAKVPTLAEPYPFPLDSSFDPADENYYRHFVPEPFPFS